MTLLALVFLGVYAWPILDPELPPGLDSTLATLNIAIWVFFGLDFVARVWLSTDRVTYILQHWIDLGLVALPVLRPLRALRAVQALSWIGRRTSVSFHGQAAVYIACAVPLIVFVGALAMLDAERRHPDANITGFGDALWWGCTTIATVGYGDRYPVSTEGRLVAVGLMIAGITLLGVITASLASWFVSRIEEVTEAEAETRREFDELMVQIQLLRDELRPENGR